MLAGLGALAMVAVALGFDEGELVLLETRDSRSHAARVKLWIVEVDGRLYLSGAAARAWVARVRRHPEVRVTRDGRDRAYRAVIVDDPAVTKAVDRAVSEKYGNADRLARVFLDRQGRLPIRLEPLLPGAATLSRAAVPERASP